MCTQRIQTNMTCEVDQSCVNGDVCFKNSCVPMFSLPVNSTCSTEAQLCLPGLYCDVSVNQCKKISTLGDSCKDDRDCPDVVT